MLRMCRWVGSVALASAVAVLTATRPASADVVYIGRGEALNEPVPLYLQIKEQRAELRLYRRDDKVDLVSPLVVCHGDCGFQLLPGAYRLQLKTPPDTDLESGTRLFDLRGPSSILVEPRSSTARWVGLGMGVLGAGMIITGVALMAEANTAVVDGNYRPDESKQFAGGALAVGGVMLSVGGWIMFGINGKPHLEIRPLGAVTPTAPSLGSRPPSHAPPALRLPPAPPAPPSHPAPTPPSPSAPSSAAPTAPAPSSPASSSAPAPASAPASGPAPAPASAPAP
jgi:hypothetical protein